MMYASPLYLLLIFSTLVCTAIGAPNTGCLSVRSSSGTLVGTLGSNSVTTNGTYTQLDVKRTRLSAQALQTQVLMSTRAMRTKALAWARSLTTLQDLWSGSWLSVTCWSLAMIIAQMHRMRLRPATVSAPRLASGVSVPVRQASCRTSFPLCTLCNPFSGAPACLICQQPLSVAIDGSCGAHFILDIGCMQ